MARGNIYYVTVDKDEDISFTENNYYDKLDTLHVDYAEDLSVEASKVPLGYMRTMLEGLGAVTAGPEDDEFAFSFLFGDAEQAKRAHFTPKLAQFKKNAEALTIEQVMASAPSFDHLLDNEFGDMVELNDDEFKSLVTVDGFIRSIKSGVTYYVYERAILIH